MAEKQGDLKSSHCEPCEGGTPLLQEAIADYLASLPGWVLAE